MSESIITDNKLPALDRRLQSILEELNAPVIADIGADHGKISVSLALTGRAKRVYAVDISSKCLLKTEALIARYHVKNVITIIGDGLKSLPELPDQIVIAGMGGLEIVKILSESGYTGRAVLAPHSELVSLREYLSGKFHIEKDYVVSSGKRFYQIIVTAPGAYEYNKADLRFGLNFPPCVDYQAMLLARRGEIIKIKEKNSQAKGEIMEEFSEVEMLCSKLGI